MIIYWTAKKMPWSLRKRQIEMVDSHAKQKPLLERLQFAVLLLKIIIFSIKIFCAIFDSAPTVPMINPVFMTLISAQPIHWVVLCGVYINIHRKSHAKKHINKITFRQYHNSCGFIVEAVLVNAQLYIEQRKPGIVHLIKELKIHLSKKIAMILCFHFMFGWNNPIINNVLGQG